MAGHERIVVSKQIQYIIVPVFVQVPIDSTQMFLELYVEVARLTEMAARGEFLAPAPAEELHAADGDEVLDCEFGPDLAVVDGTSIDDLYCNGNGIGADDQDYNSSGTDINDLGYNSNGIGAESHDYNSDGTGCWDEALTEDQELELAGIFAHFDTNGSGDMYTEELRAATAQLGFDFKEDIQKMISDVCIEEGDTFGYEEFLEMMAPRILERDCKKSYEQYGKRLQPHGLQFHTSMSGDGQISLEEYVKRMKKELTYIYYASGWIHPATSTASFLEDLRRKGFEVLYLDGTDNEDAVRQMKEFDGIKLKTASGSTSKVQDMLIGSRLQQREICEQSGKHRAKDAELLRFHTTQSGNEQISLKEYVQRMEEGQKDIYYTSDVFVVANSSSSHSLEDLRKKWYEVIYLYDPIDEYAFRHRKEFDGKKLKATAEGGLDLEDDNERKKNSVRPMGGPRFEDEGEKKEPSEKHEAEFEPLIIMHSRGFEDEDEKKESSEKLEAEFEPLIMPIRGFEGEDEKKRTSNELKAELEPLTRLMEGLGVLD